MSASTRPALVTDTTSYLAPEVLKRHDVHLVSLYVGLEGEQEREIDLLDDLDGFYERLRASEEAVTTSQPSVGDFLAVYEPLLAEGREIVSIHISAGISGTYEAAVQARDRLTADGKGGERIHVVDSRTAAGGMAMVVLGAASAAEEGGSAEEVAARAEEARANLKLWFAVDTLEYLRRGGRIGTAGAWIGTTLKIKPILTFEEEVTPVERVRTRARSIERLVGYAQAAPRGRRRRLGRESHPGSRGGREPDRGVPSDLQQRALRVVGDWTRSRRPCRPGSARHRRDDPLRAWPGLDAPASGGGAGP